MVLAANSFYLAIDPNMMLVNTIISIYYNIKYNTSPESTMLPDVF